MREILFRGKSMNGGGWVEGSLRITTHQPINDTPFKCYEIEDTTYGVFPDEFMSGICEVVDPETVGQFTGLVDKDGRKIFEGDIVDILTENEEIGVVKWDDGGFIVSADGFCVDFQHNIYGKDVEVIGNIHDNPELIGGWGKCLDTLMRMNC